MHKLIRQGTTLDGFDVFRIGASRQRRGRRISDSDAADIEAVAARAKADGYHYGPFQTAQNVTTHGYALREPTSAECGA